MERSPADHPIAEALGGLPDADPTSAGILARALAHRVRNLMNPLSLQVALLQARSDADPELARLVRGMQKSVESINELLRDLEDFGHAAAPEKKGGELEPTFQAVTRVLKRHEG